jgi:hypothetical protein
MVAARAHATCQTGRGYTIAQVSGGNPGAYYRNEKARLGQIPDEPFELGRLRGADLSPRTMYTDLA